MKELHKFLKAFIFVQLGACTARVIERYVDYIKYPELYAAQSAPWYSGIMLTVLLSAAAILITTIAFFVVGYLLKKRSDQ